MLQKIAAGDDALDSSPSTGSQQKAGIDTGPLSCVIGSQSTIEPAENSQLNQSDNLRPVENILQVHIRMNSL